MPYSLSSILGLVFKWQINAVKERKKQFVAIRMSYSIYTSNAYPERTTQLPFNGM